MTSKHRSDEVEIPEVKFPPASMAFTPTKEGLEQYLSSVLVELPSLLHSHLARVISSVFLSSCAPHQELNKVLEEIMRRVEGQYWEDVSDGRQQLGEIIKEYIRE